MEMDHEISRIKGMLRRAGTEIEESVIERLIEQNSGLINFTVSSKDDKLGPELEQMCGILHESFERVGPTVITCPDVYGFEIIESGTEGYARHSYTTGTARFSFDPRRKLSIRCMAHTQDTYRDILKIDTRVHEQDRRPEAYRRLLVSINGITVMTGEGSPYFAQQPHEILDEISREEKVVSARGIRRKIEDIPCLATIALAKIYAR